MNLVNGEVISQKQCKEVLKTLEKRIKKTLENPRLDPLLVVEACNCLASSLDKVQHEQLIVELGLPPQFAEEYINDAKIMLSRQYLLKKLETELGEAFQNINQFKPQFYDRTAAERIMPLGVLFHIAAGNADGLPVFTVIEGLLTGNINILKLPKEEGGITALILMALFEIQPLLAEYVYIFDYSSKDIDEMKQLAALSDAVVIWGGDDAIMSVRKMVTPNTKIIEWGHKISFAYCSGSIKDSDLEGIAENICKTNQLLCSSCQGIFIDTTTPEEIQNFCEGFLPILERTSKKYPSEFGIGIETQIGLKLYNESINAIFNNTKVYRGANCSITAYNDIALTASNMFRNCWVRMLPRNLIIDTLRPYKNYLQTVGLICAENEAEALAEKFWKVGAVRVTDGSSMSKIYNGMAHDGEYSLRRYTKVVTLETS